MTDDFSFRAKNTNSFGPTLGTNQNYDQLPNSFRKLEAQVYVEKNSELLDRIGKESFSDKLNIWVFAVSGRFEDGTKRNAAALEYFGERQPYWDPVALSKGTSEAEKDHLETLGNFNYGYTGYMLFVDYLTEHGIDEEIADIVVRCLLRVGGGAYQFFQDFDFRNLKFKREIDRTWYGEERKDTYSVEAGMDYARFVRFAKKVEELGINLDPKEFGFSREADFANLLDLYKFDDEEYLNEIKRMKEWLWQNKDN